MMTKLCKNTILALIVAAYFANTAWSAPLPEMPIGSEFLDVEYIVGSGNNLSVVIVDFEATAGDSYAFGYRWDSVVTFEQIVTSIQNDGPAGSSLVASLGFFPGFGAFVNNFSYDGDVGEPDNFWRLEIGTYVASNITWSTSGAGLSWLTSLHFTGTPTSDPGNLPDVQPSGTTGIIGFYNSFADDAVKPRVPTAVPEPAAWLFAAIGLFGIERVIRRRGRGRFDRRGELQRT
jgi:hypothetical protein